MSERHQRVLREIGCSDDPHRVAALLLEAQEDPSFAIRTDVLLTAFKRLEELGGEETVRVLADLLAADEDDLEIFASRTLARLDTDAVIPHLMRALTEGRRWETRINAAGALMDRDHRTAVPRVIGLLKSRFGRERLMAARALMLSDDPAALEAARRARRRERNPLVRLQMPRSRERFLRKARRSLPPSLAARGTGEGVAGEGEEAEQRNEDEERHREQGTGPDEGGEG